MENLINEQDKKKIDVEKIAKDLALDQQPKQDLNKVEYDQLYEDLIKTQRDNWIDILDSTILKTINCEQLSWDIMIKKYPEKRTTSPYARLEQMFEYFLAEFKKRHNQYLEENNLLTKEQKEGIVKTKSVKPDEVKINEIKEVKHFQ